MAKNYWIKAAENRTKAKFVEISLLNLDESIATTKYQYVDFNAATGAEAKPRIKVINSGDAMNYETGYEEGYKLAREYLDSYRALAENLKTFNSNKDNLKVI